LIIKSEHRDRAQWIVEMDRWSYRLSGAPSETVVRKSTESFQTDKTPIDQWTQFHDINEVKIPCSFKKLYNKKIIMFLSR
jgi:hypothetical protein